MVIYLDRDDVTISIGIYDEQPKTEREVMNDWVYLLDGWNWLEGDPEELESMDMSSTSANGNLEIHCSFGDSYALPRNWLMP